MVDLRTCPDHHRPSDARVAHDRTLLDDHSTFDLGGRIHVTIVARREYLEHETIALE